jgi:hypothetical protein
VPPGLTLGSIDPSKYDVVIAPDGTITLKDKSPNSGKGKVLSEVIFNFMEQEGFKSFEIFQKINAALHRHASAITSSSIRHLFELNAWFREELNSESPSKKYHPFLIADLRLKLAGHTVDFNTAKKDPVTGALNEKAQRVFEAFLAWLKDPSPMNRQVLRRAMDDCEQELKKIMKTPIIEEGFRNLQSYLAQTDGPLAIALMHAGYSIEDLGTSRSDTANEGCYNAMRIIMYISAITSITTFLANS